MPGEIGGIQDQQNRVRLGRSRHGSHQDVMRDPLIFRARLQAVDSGQIDQKDFALSVRSWRGPCAVPR